MWLPSEVLPVMSVVTNGLVMFLVERAPFSLEIEHVVVTIFLHEMDESSLDIFGRVCK